MSILDTILEKLEKGAQTASNVIGGVSDAVSPLLYGPSGPPTGADLAAIERGPQPNRGFGGIFGNLQLEGARRRVGQEKIESDRRKEEADLEYKGAASANLRSLDPYRMSQIDVKKEGNQILWYKAEIDKLDNMEKVLIEKEKLKNERVRVEAAMLDAQASYGRTTNEVIRDNAKNLMDQEKLKLDRLELMERIVNERQKTLNDTQQTANQTARLPAQIAKDEASTGLYRAGERTLEAQRGGQQLQDLTKVPGLSDSEQLQVLAPLLEYFGVVIKPGQEGLLGKAMGEVKGIFESIFGGSRQIQNVPARAIPPGSGTTLGATVKMTVLKTMTGPDGKTVYRAGETVDLPNDANLQKAIEQGLVQRIK